MHKKIGLLLATLTLFNSLCVNVGAIDMNADTDADYVVVELNMSRATASFNMNIGAGKNAASRNELPLSAGEIVRIRANYAPETASLDFGLVDPDGTFHYVNTKSGSINKSIKIPNNGTYVFAIRNNSNVDVKVSGIVQY